MRLFDMHCDTLYECFQTGAPLVDNRLHIDLTRGLRVAAPWAQVFAVWLPDTLRGKPAYEQCREILEQAHREAENNAGKMAVVRTAEDMRKTLSSGRCAALLAVEGGAALAGSLEHIRDLAALDVKILTLTWNGDNELGCGCCSKTGTGLTPFGKCAVRELETYGILPDVSHLNERGFWDVAELSGGPVIASHSVSAAVHPNPRNLTDAQFAAVRDSGGVVGLNVCAAQLGEQSFSCIERHLYHYLSLGGERTVGFGCDFNGTELPPEWNGVEMLEGLYDYLCRKNYEEACLERLFFGNCYDFFTAALTRGGSCISMKGEP